ncbi:MAG TPA: LacI family DNA-binding transcriptional regulator [Pseudolabrys sp.]|nr:LacI family DNA-binding transcriptional regulator [Pseudolabrys sp.]
MKRGIPVTIKQVAAAAGVHYSTVSRALNPATRSKVTPDLADRVIAAAKRLGYRANAAASTLRTRQSKIIGFLVPDLGSLLFPQILVGIEQEFRQAGYLTVVADTGNDPQQHKRILSGLTERQVDGLIVATATLREPVAAAWPGERIPIVLLNRTDDTGLTPAVLHDDQSGIGMAVSHLINLGHRHIAHIAGPSWLSTGVARRRGFRLAIDERLPGTPQIIAEAAQYSREAGRTACLGVLAAHPQITAIVAANDLLAIGCCDALTEHGLTCPGDVSVTGYNDIALADVVRPSLTTVQLNHREMGAEAARLLMTLMAGQERRSDIVLRPTLVVRQSTAMAQAG